MQHTMPRLIAAAVAILVVTGGAIGLAVFRTLERGDLAAIARGGASGAVVAPSASPAPGGAGS